MRTLSALPLFLLTLTFACGEEKPETGEPEETGATDTNDPGTGPCGAYSGISGLGSHWTYTGTYTDPPSTYTIETDVTALDTSTGALTFTSTTSGEAQGIPYSVLATTELRCDDDGMWLLSSYSETTYTIQGNPQTSTATIDYDPPALQLPKGIAVGSTWTTENIYVLTTGTGQQQPGSSTVNNEVEAEESVTVTAGTYTALKVQQSGDGHATSWMDKDLGTVKMVDSTGWTMELTAYTP